MMPDEPICSRCGRSRTQVIAQSVSPPGVFVRCSDCGHSTLVPGTPGSQSQVDGKRIERLVTTVITAKMLPHRVVAVEKTGEAWKVTIRPKVGDSLRFELKADSMKAMRAAIERALAPAS